MIVPAFHATDADNVPAILRHGLGGGQDHLYFGRCEEGCIDFVAARDFVGRSGLIAVFELAIPWPDPAMLQVRARLGSPLYGVRFYTLHTDALADALAAARTRDIARGVVLAVDDAGALIEPYTLLSVQRLA